MEPLKQFICDRCRETINSPEQGVVEWISETETGRIILSGFKIIHHAEFSPYQHKTGKCSYHYRDTRLNDKGLNDCVYPNGFGFQLSLIDVGPHFNHDYQGPEGKDLREVTELMRRLSLPFYEEARLYWDRANSDNFFGSANEIAVYLPETLQALIKRYKPEGKE